MARPLGRMTGRAARLGPRWLARLKRELDQPSSGPRWPLELRCHGRAAARIGSVEPMLAQRLADAGMPLRAIGGVWCIEVIDMAAVDPALATLAQWLRGHGLAPAWRDEPLQSPMTTAGRSPPSNAPPCERSASPATRCI